MRIDILTVFPDMLEGFFNCSMMARAQKAGLADIHLHDIRDYTTDKHHKTDDYPFGGCAGLVMKIEPIDRLITDLKSQRDYDEVIYTSPDGEQFNQKTANSLSLLNNIIILCGHYKGIDYRIREHLITREISIGDYVLTGGELAAAVMTDSIVRLIPGVLFWGVDVKTTAPSGPIPPTPYGCGPLPFTSPWAAMVLPANIPKSSARLAGFTAK